MTVIVCGSAIAYGYLWLSYTKMKKSKELHRYWMDTFSLHLPNNIIIASIDWDLSDRDRERIFYLKSDQKSEVGLNVFSFVLSLTLGMSVGGGGWRWP